ncbi:MAG: hypothetical protein M1150_01120 [Patescibacteria group bacterium]|nr:hypothetical protein [Patescibacteria group bacterium]
MKKYFLIALLAMILTFQSTSLTLAQNKDDLGLGRLIQDVKGMENKASRTAEKEGDNLESLKKVAEKMISKRNEELNKLIDRVNEDKQLSETDKSSLKNDIQNVINALNGLKSKIDEETNIEGVRNDMKQIVSSYRVYEVLTPKTRLIITIDRLQALLSRLQGLTPKLQDLIDSLKFQGKDVTALQALLNDINNQLSTINVQLSTDKSNVLGVSVSTSSPKEVFDQVQNDLAHVRNGFTKIRSDVAQMRKGFRIVLNNNPSSTPSASPSAHED